MPTPALLPVELEALINEDITDELDQQNTAQRVREVLLYMVGSLGVPAGPGVPSNPDYAALMLALAKKADKTAVATSLSQKEQLFKPFAQSELDTIEYAYSNLALRPLVRALIKAVASGVGGTGGGTFADDFIVSQSGGATFGKYRNGQTVPAKNRTAIQVILDAAIDSIYPAYNTASVSAQQSAPADGELGESVSNTITGTFNPGDAGAVTAMRAYRGNQAQIGASSTTSPITRTVQMVRALSPTPIWVVADYAAGVVKTVSPGNTPDPRTPAVRNPNAPQAAEVGLSSPLLYFTGYYNVFFGATSTTPVDSATTRNLSQNQLTSQGSQGILNTGTTATQFAIALPPGYRLLSVFDLDNQGANITSAYAAQDTVSVKDAGGAAHDYFLYLYRTAGPYPVSARHQFTYGT